MVVVENLHSCVEVVVLVFVEEGLETVIVFVCMLPSPTQVWPL
jgi:hypothetical protein